MKIGILEYCKYHQIYIDTLTKLAVSHQVKKYDTIDTAVQDSSNLDILFINTIRPVPWDILKFLMKKIECKTVWTIHEANTEIKTSSVLLKKIDAINVFTPEQKTYITKHTKYDKKIYTIPFMLHEKVYPNLSNMYVVPGKIEKNRRDYHKVLEYISKKDRWCLLGEPIGAYGQDIIEQCKNMNYEGYNIQYFTTFVPKKLYEAKLQDCKCIVSPIHRHTKGLNKLFTETYGQTKMYGAYYEAIKYAKPLKTIIDMSLVNVPICYYKYKFDDWLSYFDNMCEEICNV